MIVIYYRGLYRRTKFQHMLMKWGWCIV